MNDQQENSLEYHNISLLVRPARVAILIYEGDEYWKHVILHVFAWCSKVWGGAYFLIVPTDGKKIKGPFWSILEEYSPDHVFSFIPTLQDLKIADPPKYESVISQHKRSIFQQDSELTEVGFNELVDRYINWDRRYDFEIDDKLQQQIKQRLSPFYHREYIVQERISAHAPVPFPLTQLENIVQQGKLEKVYVVDDLEDVDCSLIFFSNWGLYRAEFENVLTEKGIKVNHIPKEAQLTDLLQFSISKSANTLDTRLKKELRNWFGETDTSWYPDEDIARYSPYEASLLNVGKYKVNEPYYGSEPITLIVGGTVVDFCLYYCLSRMQDAVYWIPDINCLAKHTKDSELEAKTILCKTVARAINDQDRYSHSKKTISISSFSLSADELNETRKELLRHMYLSEGTELKVVNEQFPLILEKSTLRLIEKNNYTNQYTEVFQNNKGIGRIPTPRPKNFGQVIPYDHRWITELNIERYTPPQLHFLGKDIVDLRGLTNETRIAKTGICYTCPNIGYFGGDIDVTLVRPKINIIEPLDIFSEYFGEAGYKEIHISDKGNYTQETINKFGSLDEIGDFLRDKRNRDFLALFLRKRSLKNSITGEVVFANGRIYIDFQAIRHLIGSEEQTIQLVDMFIREGILYRGTLLHCSRCREADWYDLEELDQTFTCHRCKQSQALQQKNWKEGREPTWYYKLDEVIYQGIKNDMVLPILTLAYLNTKAKSSFLYVPELEFRRTSSSSKPEKEVDICCIQDGKIILGECRKSNISKDLTDKLNLFAGGLLKTPDQLIFATLSEKVSPEIIAHAKSTSQVPVSFIKKADLVSS